MREKEIKRERERKAGGAADNVSYFLFDSFRRSPEPERLKNKLKLSGRCCAFSTNSNVQSMPQLPTSDRDFTGK